MFDIPPEGDDPPRQRVPFLCNYSSKILLFPPQIEQNRLNLQHFPANIFENFKKVSEKTGKVSIRMVKFV